ncbi:RNA-binding protein [Nonomuraea sp. NPDC050383]|uniref:RNA-binding protein n=1 Tax=Nonomuraea sp. NPDC050383 TaxID=3364362 RepID=UPI003791AEBD
MSVHVHRITKYDPADRTEHGSYAGPEDVHSDHGPVEAAYLEAVAAFAEETGITHLTIREPGVTGFVNFGVEPPLDGHGLAGLFPPDLTGYHDGARVPMAVALELVRAMLRDNGAWCRLEDEDRFFVHVGYDQYVYVGSESPCPHAVALTHHRGLFAEPMSRSPYDPRLDDDDEDDAARRRPADGAFWAELDALLVERGAVVLEEGYVSNASRWHRITADEVAATRGGLAPRARLLVWPDLSTDVDATLDALAGKNLVEIVWQDPQGHITSLTVDDPDNPGLPARLAGARAMLVLSGYADDRHPLLAAVLPDPDGVLRARWLP